MGLLKKHQPLLLGNNSYLFIPSRDSPFIAITPSELPDSLAKHIHRLAGGEGMSPSQFLASAAAEKVAVWETQDILKQEVLWWTLKRFAGFSKKSQMSSPSTTGIAFRRSDFCRNK